MKTSKKSKKSKKSFLTRDKKMLKMESELNRLRKQLDRVDNRVLVEARKNSKKYAKKYMKKSSKKNSKKRVKVPLPPGCVSSDHTLKLYHRIDELEKTVFTLIDRLETVEEEYRTLTRPMQIVM